MTEIPPTRARVLEVRAAGVRPRSRHLGLAIVAASVAAGLELGVGSGSFDRLTPTSGIATDNLALGSAAGLVVLLVVVIASHHAVIDRGPNRRRLAVTPELASLPSWTAQGLGLLAIVALAWLGVDALAGAARSVDSSAEALVRLWSGLAVRGLLGLAAVAAGIGVIERWLSARRLWRALHRTPAQVRERAR